MNSPTSGMQKLLDAMAASRVSDAKARTETRAFAAAIQKSRTSGWDPHEVWLTRVKQPRDMKRAG